MIANRSVITLAQASALSDTNRLACNAPATIKPHQRMQPFPLADHTPHDMHDVTDGPPPHTVCTHCCRCNMAVAAHLPDLPVCLWEESQLQHPCWSAVAAPTLKPLTCLCAFGKVLVATPVLVRGGGHPHLRLTARPLHRRTPRHHATQAHAQCST